MAPVLGGGSLLRFIRSPFGRDPYWSLCITNSNTYCNIRRATQWTKGQLLWQVRENGGAEYTQFSAISPIAKDKSDIIYAAKRTRTAAAG